MAVVAHSTQPAHDDALRVLENRQYPCSRIIRVDRDSVLFLGVLNQPHTAWIHRRENGRLIVTVVDGFSAIPPDGLHQPPPENFGLTG